MTAKLRLWIHGSAPGFLAQKFNEFNLLEGRVYEITSWDLKENKINAFKLTESSHKFEFGEKTNMYEIIEDNYSSNVTWVKELVQEDGKSWNRSLLTECFRQSDVEAILNIKSLDPLLSDRWKWVLDAKAEGSDSAQRDRQIRGRSWMDPSCCSCGKEWESVEHVLLHCVRAKRIWKLAPVLRLLTQAHSNNGGGMIKLTTYILWWLWKAQNLWKFEAVWMPDDALLRAGDKVAVKKRKITRSILRMLGQFIKVVVHIVFHHVPPVVDIGYDPRSASLHWRFPFLCAYQGRMDVYHRGGHDSFFKRKHEEIEEDNGGLPTDEKVVKHIEKSPRNEQVVFDINNLERDPGLRMPISSYPVDKIDEVRRAYISYGPYQYKGEYPSSGGSGKYSRRFQASWFKIFPSWLEYSPTSDAACPDPNSDPHTRS
ncbi:52 kDa repressor of the inhibitor of the proteinkinase [Striga asiatica]|uniref:52 kDa repressor of the inhibitor of the proteinkinase n=1 Tax=Striga asiatica TaxID=4170 RepID=A0A5A7QLE0_STRAF|nr:52 kDa repressor of the inhibitor of the proteinkinase [Striga asiatica]